MEIKIYMEKIYSLDKVWYVILSNGQIKTFFQNNNYSVDDEKGKRIYISKRNETIIHLLNQYFVTDRLNEGFEILRLSEYVDAFLNAIDSRSSKQEDSFFNKLTKEQLISEKEAIYIGNQIQQKQRQREDNNKALNIV